MTRAAAVLAWIGVVLLADGVRALDGVEGWRQAVLGLGTWLVLAALLRRETPLVRTQTLVVVGLATCVEYTFSPLLQAYVYRLGTVPPFVPPGHGLVYLAALALGYPFQLELQLDFGTVHRRRLELIVIVAGDRFVALFGHS